MEFYPKTGEIYLHYKGGEYEIISMAIHSETAEKMVVYKSVTFGTMYVRPFEIWKTWANADDKNVGIPRFKLIRHAQA